MVNRLPSQGLKPGDQVAVRWTFDTVDAVVEATYQTPRGVQVQVRVPVLGPAGEEIGDSSVTVPLEAIESVYAN